MKKKLLAIVVSTAMALSLVGCMAEELSMDFQKDGSGSATIGVYMADEFIEAMGTTPEEMFEDQEGTITKKTYDGKPYTGIVETQKFNSVSELNSILEEKSEDADASSSVTFKEGIENGKKTVTVTMDFAETEASGDDTISFDASASDIEDIQNMFHMTVDLTFPGGISHVAGDKSMYTIKGNTAHIDLNVTNEAQTFTVVGVLRDATGAEIKVEETAKAIEAKFANVASYDGRFQDVPDTAWYKESLVRAYNIGSVNGTSSTTYSPNAHLTRAQVIVMAARLRSVYDGDGEQFTVQGGQTWYSPYVEYAIKKGIITEGKFDNYSADANRAEMAYVFANALPEECYAAIGNEKTFSDVPATDSYYTAITRLANAGIVNGTGEGKYTPSASVTRAQAAVFVARLTTPAARG